MPLSRFAPNQYNLLLKDKEQRLVSLLSEFTEKRPDLFASPVNHFRFRAEFRFWHHGNTADYVLFPKGQSKDPKIIHDFPIGSKLINKIMPLIKREVLQHDELKHRLFQIEFLTSLSGQCLVTLIYHKPLTAHWQALAKNIEEKLGISIIGRSKKQKIVLSQDYIDESLMVNGNSFQYRQIEGGFTQPNAYMNQNMLSWACHQLSQQTQSDLLELYCGNANFTIPLSRHFNQVLATEISKSSIKAAIFNKEINKVDNIKLCRMSSEEFTAAYNKERPFRRLKEAGVELDNYNFSTVLVDPPRAGLDKASLALISQFDQILYISCNPNTLTDNLRSLTITHHIQSTALFDQFPYTDHIESGVLLTKR